MSLSKSAKYYRKNRGAAKKKQKYDAELNKRPEQVKKRVEANRARRNAKKEGKNINGKDYHHGTNSFIDSSKNRGMRGEGGRKYKKRK